MTQQSNEREKRENNDKIVQDDLGEREWYRLSPELWLLIGGLVLFNIGCFFNSNIITSIWGLLEFRLCPWWYFVGLLLIVVFSIKWFQIFRAWDDLEPTDSEIAKRFLHMSITISAEILIIILLNAVGFIRPLSLPLWYWLNFGHYSHAGILVFLVICIAVTATVYVIKEWLIAVFQS